MIGDALVRTLAEIYRLRAVRGPGFALADALPYVSGAMIAAIAAVSMTILVMLAYKVAVLGW